MNPEILRTHYHQLVTDGIFAPHLDYPWMPADKPLLHRFINEHVDHMLAVYRGEIKCSASNEILGKLLFGFLVV